MVTIPNEASDVKNGMPAFIERPYGSKLQLTASSQIIVIAPHSSTADGADPKTLDNDGLRDHDAPEHVKFLGFADGKGDDGTIPLLYRFRDKDGGGIVESLFSVGDEFDSVGSELERKLHVLIDDSDRPIMLLIRVGGLESTRALKR